MRAQGTREEAISGVEASARSEWEPEASRTDSMSGEFQWSSRRPRRTRPPSRCVSRRMQHPSREIVV
jgi:hypothetical protein